MKKQLTTCCRQGMISQEAIQSHVAAKPAILLFGIGQRQEHAEHGHILIIVARLLNPIRADRFGL